MLEDPSDREADTILLTHKNFGVAVVTVLNGSVRMIVQQHTGPTECMNELIIFK